MTVLLIDTTTVKSARLVGEVLASSWSEVYLVLVPEEYSGCYNIPSIAVPSSNCASILHLIYVPPQTSLCDYLAGVLQFKFPDQHVYFFSHRASIEPLSWLTSPTVEWIRKQNYVDDEEVEESREEEEPQEEAKEPGNLMMSSLMQMLSSERGQKAIGGILSQFASS